MAEGSTPQSLQWRQLELALNLEVEEGLLEPDEVNLPELVQQFDQMLEALPERELLNYGGRYLDKLSALYHARAMMLLDDWEEEYNSEGPRFSDDLLVGLIKEHQTVDVSAFVKPTQRFHPPKVTGPLDEQDSVFVQLDTAQAIELAEQDLAATSHPDQSHAEHVSDWIKTIEQYLQDESDSAPVRLIELYRHIELKWVELILALLLGGFELKQTGSFYERDSIWLYPKPLPRPSTGDASSS